MNIPTYGVSVQPDSDGKLWMALTIQTEETNYMSFLCRADTYEQVASEFHKNIMKAGNDMRRAQREQASGLVVAHGDSEVKAHVQAERRLKRG